MADKLESALNSASDAAYVRAIDSNGNSIQISKADLAEVIRENMNVVTNVKNGLMGTDSYRTFSPLRTAWIPASGYIDLDIKMNGHFTVVCPYSRYEATVYIVSTEAGILEKLGPTNSKDWVSLVDGKVRLTNPNDVETDMLYCYQAVRRND